jgi:hypothetical protein
VSIPATFPNVVLANAGLSMLRVQFPAMLCALVPVIMVEIMVARRMLRLDTARAAAAVVPANLVSTVLGFPLLWLLLLVIQILVGGGTARGLSSFWSRLYSVTVQAPWLIPYGHDLNWMVPVASVYLLIPAFFASVFIERWICSLIWRDQAKSRLRRFSWRAHFVSYAVLLWGVAIYYLVRIKLS